MVLLASEAEPTPAAGLHGLRAADATTPSVSPSASPGCRDFLSRSLSGTIPPIISPRYITVILGSPFRSAYRHVTRFPGTEKGVVPLADNPRSDDGEKVS